MTLDALSYNGMPRKHQQSDKGTYLQLSVQLKRQVGYPVRACALQIIFQTSIAGIIVVEPTGMVASYCSYAYVN